MERPTEIGLTAVDARRFVDSVGVNVHLSYLETGYADVRGVRRALASLCVDHVRDNVPQRHGGRLASVYRGLAADGRSVVAVVGSPGRRDTLAEPAPTVDWLAAEDLAPEPVEAIEGPNEWDARGGEDWASEVRTYQRELARLVQRRFGDSVILVGPSTARPGRRSELGDLSAVVDVASIHAYPAGAAPDVLAEEQAREARSLAGEESSSWVTETGYQTSGDEQNGQPSVSEHQQAAYVPRLLGEAFLSGVQRTYIYELLDDPAHDANELQFGLYHADFVPKPAARAVATLMCAAGQQGSSVPASQPLRVALVEPPSGLRTLLLARADGSLVLLAWQNGSVAPVSGGQPQGTASLRLRIDGHVRASVVTDLAVPARKPAVVEEGTVEVEITDGVVLVELEPG